MPEPDTAATARPENPNANQSCRTEEFDTALEDAGRLLEYAASSGLLPEGTSNAAEALIQDIVLAQEAARSKTLTTQIVIRFWIAYGHLAHLVDPVTAASLAACKKISLLGLEVRAAMLVAAIIVFSIFLFMSTATLNDTSDLIDQQNAAALKLWSDIQMLRTSHDKGAAGTAANDQTGVLIAERVFEETVEFARRNTWLLQSASRLNYWFTPPWMIVSPEHVKFDATNKDGLTHLNVQPSLSTTTEIENEGFYQITAYQFIRDYALGLYKINTLIYSSLSTYFLPTIYALLGAFLYGFRYYSRLIRRKEFLPSEAHSARYFIAAIAGLVLGLFGSLLPKSMALPPLAVAFMVGYAVEAFFSRLDGMIRKLRDVDDVLPATRRAEAMSGD
jgi:hypothetical protein